MMSLTMGPGGVIHRVSRYYRTDDVLKLALRLASSYEGLPLEDIQAEFAVSRRTAERMRDAIDRVLALLHGDDLMRLWRMDRITKMTPLDETFARRRDFNLEDFAARS